MALTREGQIDAEPTCLGAGARNRARVAATGPGPLVRGLLRIPRVEPTNLIEIRHVRVNGRTVPVELSRNAGGSVAARCLIGETEMPIIDGPTAEAAMAAVEEAIEDLLFARALRGAR